MSKISTAKLVVDNNSTEEVIAYIVDAMRLNREIIADAVNDQNMLQAGVGLCNYQYVEGILIALNEKLNGKKEPTVVQ